MKKSGKLVITILTAAVLVLTLLVTGCGTEKVQNKVLTLSPYAEEKGKTPVTYTGKFTGELKGDKPHGNGVFKFQMDGVDTTYTGGFKNGKFDGAGIIEYSDTTSGWNTYYKTYDAPGYTYKIRKQEVNCKEGLPHGKIKTYLISGTICREIDYKDGKMNGKDLQYHAKGKIYRDFEMKDGKPHGIGKMWYENGQLGFEVEYKDGNANGKGKEYYKNGQIRFDGEYKDGKRSEGTLYNQNGSVQYQGKFVDGKPVK
ncbi:MAG: hypothetical protein SPL86_06860 [Succiniclasticum sp.]|uniref:toxin-antitoxin system YwqK family antitoxin n=1 Tax=Succiniclasticum sp. TaxID=2775030 RepID=UPI002A9157B1|nr:hypothetical protein [Succiniclasticum sp.]MDY6291187.1 hypothetical protein [Succiniclasticum sp.]